MSSFRFSASFFATATVASAQLAAGFADHPVNLDQVVISAGYDNKTAFDLAQGSSLLSGPDLQRRAQTTLGETLESVPGVSSTYYGPGASRPIIRGLGGDRIRVLQSGVGALDASNVSPDHTTAIEPLFARRVEVLRGPATLLYGGSAVGGVVNVVDNRIPETPASSPFSGAVEVRGFGPADESTGVAALTAGTPGWAVQLNLLKRHTGDLRIPGVARIDAEAPADQRVDRLPNSDVDTESGSLGATWFGPAGHAGAAFGVFETEYGVPVDEPISIRLRQRRFDFHGDLTRPVGLLRGARLQFGVGDYRHSEVLERTTVNTTFRNRAWESRLELPHEFSSSLNGTWGVQVSRSDFSAVGEEVVTPPSVTQSGAVFALEEWRSGPVALQVGGRVERQSIRLGEVPDDLPAVPGYGAESGEKNRTTAVSGSAGVVVYPAKDWSIGLALAYAQRPPTAQELYSNGPHGGTGSWEVGRADLGKEKSVGLDLSLRKRAGFVTGSVGAFVNRFQGYIFEERLPDDAIPVEINEEGLTPYQFTARDAQFYGAEAEVVLHLIERSGFLLHLELSADYVRAEERNSGAALPRIPPFRSGVALRAETSSWQLGVELRSAGRQDRIADEETPTPGYTLLNVDGSYQLRWGRLTYDLFVRATNLTDEEARVHTSLLKEFAPLPGRGVVAGVRLAF